MLKSDFRLQLPPNPEELIWSLNDVLKPLVRYCLRSASGGLKHPYVVPGGYEQAWDWDTYFIAVAIAEFPESWPHLKGTVLNFFDQMDDQGRCPRWLHPQHSFWESGCIGADGFAKDLAKPFFAQTADLYSRTTGDYEWFRGLLEPQRRFLDAWRRERMGHDGLYVWANGLESGGDSHPDVFGWPDFSVEGVDLAVFLIREYLAAARLARKLDEHSHFQYFLASARFLAHQLEALLYDPATNRFYNRWRPNGQFIKVSTQAQFYPLWLGSFLSIDREMRRAMLTERLMDPAQFWSPYGIRSTSKKEPIYNNSMGAAPSNWQGPIWIVSNHIHLMSLIDNGMQEEAIALAYHIQKLLLADLEMRGQMSECYHAETGEPLAVGGFIGWNLLARLMMRDALWIYPHTLINPTVD